MRSARHKPLLASLLAGFYALAAAFGHALHDHGACADTVACSHGDACPFEHEPTDDHSDGWRGAGHDPHSCAACQLIAQLKLGHAGSSETAEFSRLVSQADWSAQPGPLSSESTPFDARGPPAC